MRLRTSLIAVSCVAVFAGGLTAASAQSAAGSGIAGHQLTRTDLNFSIAAPSDEWTWEAAQPRPDMWVFKATHLATRSQALLSVVPLRPPFNRSLADNIVAGMVESIVGRQPGFAEAGRSLKPSQVPRPGSFRVETSLRNEAQGVSIRAWGYIFAGERLFSLFVLSAHDSGEQALESLIGSFRFLREPATASLSSTPAPADAARPDAGSTAPARSPASGVGVLYLLLVLLFAGLGWLVNKVAGRPSWDAARTALLLLLILLVIQIALAVGAGGPDPGRAAGRAIGTALIPLVVAAWLSSRFRRAKAAQPGEGAPPA